MCDPNPSWERLCQIAVKGAEYNSRERQPHPKCLPETRVEFLAHINELLDNDQESRIIWVYGMAGVGKSAVAFTIADRMRDLKVTEEKLEEKRLAGTFFFSRKYTKRCMTGYFFATLVYQLANNFPSIKGDVINAISNNPSLLHPDKPLPDQMEALFLKPLRRLQLRLHKCPPVVFVVDALDECSSEAEIIDLITLLGQALRDPGLPVIHLLLTSRPEAHIRAAIQEYGVHPRVREISVKSSGAGVACMISLDGADVDSDIRIFLQHEFKMLRSRYPNFPQPTQHILKRLASRAGRRFIVASTMMKFIDDGYNDPRDRLQLMLELTSTLLPGTEVFKLYDQIICTCADPLRVYQHLSVVATLANPLPIAQISELLGPGEGKDVERALVQLRSLMDIPTNPDLPVGIYHSSVRDYVSNPSHCNLGGRQSIAPPHPLLARGSFRLMIENIPESMGLLDALSELNKHNRAIEPRNPQSIMDSFATLASASLTPWSVIMTLVWLRGGRDWLESQGLEWLQTKEGERWLSESGSNWLETQDGKDWLNSHRGWNWLDSSSGRRWLSFQPHETRDWLQSPGGLDWLQSSSGNKWLRSWYGSEWLNSQKGRHWLQSKRGKHWLSILKYDILAPNNVDDFQKNLDVLLAILDEEDWLQTPDGTSCLETAIRGDWLLTEGGRKWLNTARGELWLSTLGGDKWLGTSDGDRWLGNVSGQYWLSTSGGYKWLGTAKGRDWLSTSDGDEWLGTAKGRRWLSTSDGDKWLGTSGGDRWLGTVWGKIWLSTSRGYKWLGTAKGGDWLPTGGRTWLLTKSGEHWLSTSGGYEWLGTTTGRDWLSTSGGDRWLSVLGRRWLQTEDAQTWMQTEGGQKWRQARKRDWLQIKNGKGGLQTYSGAWWLESESREEWLGTEDGREWLYEQGANWFQTKSGTKWLESESGTKWLESESGTKWLESESGTKWLKSESGTKWLESRNGTKWLESESGTKWLESKNVTESLESESGTEWPESYIQDLAECILSDPEATENWLKRTEGRRWLKTKNGRYWLDHSDGSLDWLCSESGHEWLQTRDGQEWLDTESGQSLVFLSQWLDTQSGREWLQSQSGYQWQRSHYAEDWLADYSDTPDSKFWLNDFLETLEAITTFNITPDFSLLPPFRAIQQFKTLPDFLMFPAFLALTPKRDFLASEFKQGSDMHEVIHAMKAFVSFADEARERIQSQTTSGALTYAYQNWARHLSQVPNPWDDKLDCLFNVFWNKHLLSWLERQWISRGLRSCLPVLSEAQTVVAKKLANSSQTSESDLMQDVIAH